MVSVLGIGDNSSIDTDKPSRSPNVSKVQMYLTFFFVASNTDSCSETLINSLILLPIAPHVYRSTHRVAFVGG